MKVKICGITDIRTAVFAAEQGADALGFVFAESRRKIAPAAAKKIISELRADLLKVGVFVNESVENIERIASEAGLTAIQLHGDEPPEFCRKFTLPVIKAISVTTVRDLEKISSYDCEYVLLDSPAGKYCGGSGLPFDWGLLKKGKFHGKKIILAGGLHEGNIRTAICKVRPYMVDVSSGVETDGKKDLKKIRRFISAAKNPGLHMYEGEENESAKECP